MYSYLTLIAALVFFQSASLYQTQAFVFVHCRAFLLSRVLTSSLSRTHALSLFLSFVSLLSLFFPLSLHEHTLLMNLYACNDSSIHVPRLVHMCDMRHTCDTMHVCDMHVCDMHVCDMHVFDT